MQCACLDPSYNSDSSCTGSCEFPKYKGDGNCDDENKYVDVPVSTVNVGLKSRSEVKGKG